MKLRQILVAMAAIAAAVPPVLAQDHGGHQMPQEPAAHDEMGGMAGMERGAMQGAGLFGAYPMTRDASGTAWQPDLASHGGVHTMWGNWSLMGHARLTGLWDTQSGPRGDEGFYFQGMLMGSARRDFPNGDTLGFRIMLSPDPLGGKRGYPLLLQSGETADGLSHLTDRQHPHDLFMELAGSYSHRIAERASVFLYAGYPGEPALGPPAFMHRPSSIDMPAAPLSHHWLDSTHIVFGVVTGGIVLDDVKLEVSRFTGREPDQHRFDFDGATFDSTSARVSWNPDEHWSLQASIGYLNTPEQLEPERNEIRYTASALYVLPLGEDSSWSSMLAFGRKHLNDGHTFDAWLFETAYQPDDAWTLFARAESVETEELFASHDPFTVGALSLGAIHDWRVAEHAKVGLGAQYAFDFAPEAPLPSYGSDPHGAMVFVRLNLE